MTSQPLREDPPAPPDPGEPYPVPDPGVPYPFPDPQRTPPYTAYAAITGTFLGAVSLVAVAGRRRDLPRYTPLEAGALALATFKAARTLARDEVTSFIREPFVEEDERPVETGGARQAIGELVTCTRCVGTWAAAGLVAAETFTPSFGRILIRTLAVGGANDWLQAGFAALTETRTR
jgi:hypothetical protein